MKQTRALLIKFLDKKFPQITRSILSAVFLYFVSMMIVMGNGASFLGHYLSFLYRPVANTIGLNTTWNFFSPDPAHTMYIKVNYTMVDGSYLSDILPQRSEDGEFDFSLNRRRMSYIVRFLIIDPTKIEEFLAPWLCRQHRQAETVHIETIIEKMPPLEKVMTLKDTIFNDLVEKQSINSLNYPCSKAETL